MRHFARVGLIALSLVMAPALATLPGSALAAPGGGGGSDDGGWSASGAEELQQAEQLIEGARYQEAIFLLEGVVSEDLDNADAFNWLGYATRQLGRFDEAVDYYQQALDIDPEHRGALEYLGEAYLAMDDLAAAEAMLVRLDDACWFSCDEFDQLEQAIAAYRAQRETN